MLSKRQWVLTRLRLSNVNPNSKFTKEVTVNGVTMLAFVDFGSEVTLIRESVNMGMGLQHNSVPIHQ